MPQLIEGKIYMCADQVRRRLDKIEEDFLTYSIPIDRTNGKYTWMKVSKTYRWSVEEEFTKGIIIEL